MHYQQSTRTLLQDIGTADVSVRFHKSSLAFLGPNAELEQGTVWFASA